MDQSHLRSEWQNRHCELPEKLPESTKNFCCLYNDESKPILWLILQASGRPNYILEIQPELEMFNPNIQMY
jgi:hypothetical protein